MKRIFCLYTGGTIGCVDSPNGLIPQQGILLPLITDLLSSQIPQTVVELLEYNQPLDSAAMTPQHWRNIAAIIVEHAAQYDGFVVLHGTDTMAWTGAALHWQLANFDKSVVLTGAQRPWVHAGSDAPANMLLALNTAASEQTGVLLAFGGMLLPAYCIKKLDADADAAFGAPNAPRSKVVCAPNAPTNKVVCAPNATRNKVVCAPDTPRENVVCAPNTPNDKTTSASTEPFSSPPHAHLPRQLSGTATAADDLPFNYLALNPALKILSLKLYPGCENAIASMIHAQQWDGIAIESYGSGNLPNHAALTQALAAQAQRGAIIINCTQCIAGEVRQGLYAAGDVFNTMGAWPAGRRSIEAATTWLYTHLGRAPKDALALAWQREAVL